MCAAARRGEPRILVNEELPCGLHNRARVSYHLHEGIPPIALNALAEQLSDKVGALCVVASELDSAVSYGKNNRGSLSVVTGVEQPVLNTSGE